MVDIKRQGKSKLRKRIRTTSLVVLGLAAIGGATFGLTRLKPAAPTLERSTAVIQTVKRGQMLREVRGIGTLVPQSVRYIPAPADGRVEQIPVQAGVTVGYDTVIVTLSNPQLQQEAMDAEFQVKATQADKESLRARLESESMTQESAIASIKAEYSRAQLQLDTDEVLGKQGLVSGLLLKISRMQVQELGNRLKVEQLRLVVGGKSVQAQIKAQELRVQGLRALAKLKSEQVEALNVRAGTSGVLQQVSVQVGQQVTPGLNIALVADPASSKSREDPIMARAVTLIRSASLSSVAEYAYAATLLGVRVCKRSTDCLDA